MALQELLRAGGHPVEGLGDVLHGVSAAQLDARAEVAPDEALGRVGEVHELPAQRPQREREAQRRERHQQQRAQHVPAQRRRLGGRQAADHDPVALRHQEERTTRVGWSGHHHLPAGEPRAVATMHVQTREGRDVDALPDPRPGRGEHLWSGLARL